MIENNPRSQVGAKHDERDATSSGPEFEPLVELVREVGSAMENHNLSSIDLRFKDLRLSIVAHDHAMTAPTTTARNGRQDDETTHNAPSEVDPGIHTVTAPMIGTFYVAPAPNEPPFVNAGDVVEEGQTIGIIEAMKIMNEIASDMGGEIVDVIAKNGETVEFGSPLVTLRTRG